MLGSPEHTAVTVNFLNSVFSGAPRITSVEILNPILGQETDDDTLAIAVEVGRRMGKETVVIEDAAAGPT